MSKTSAARKHSHTRNALGCAMADPLTALPPTFADLTRDGLFRELDAQRIRADVHHSQSIATPDADAIGTSSVTTWSDHTKESAA